MLLYRADMITNKVTFAALAAITVALAFAVVPALTNQVFAQDSCPGCQGKGHERDPEVCVNESSGKEKEGECSGNSLSSPNKQEEQVVYKGKSGNIKGEI